MNLTRVNNLQVLLSFIGERILGGKIRHYWTLVHLVVILRYSCYVCVDDIGLRLSGEWCILREQVMIVVPHYAYNIIKVSYKRSLKFKHLFQKISDNQYKLIISVILVKCMYLYFLFEIIYI